MLQPLPDLIFSRTRKRTWAGGNMAPIMPRFRIQPCSQVMTPKIGVTSCLASPTAPVTHMTLLQAWL